MKRRIFCLVLALCLMAGGAYAAPGTQLGFDVLAAMYAEGENSILSPLSLGYALSMAALGAQGDTRNEMLAMLECEDPAEIAAAGDMLEQAGLMAANAAFLTGDLLPKEAYAEALRDAFGAKWFENKGNMVERINAWVEDYTDGQIDRLLSEPLNDDIALVLVNALAMQAKWRLPFDEYNSYAEPFHALGGEVEAEFMHQTAYMTYGERDGVQLLRLDYVNHDYERTGLHMLLALPEAGGIPGVLAGLQDEGLEYFTFREDVPEVRLSMPKMDITVENSLVGPLRALGMQLAFSDTADFRGITDMPMWISSVIQKARVQVDEEGTKAAAATAIAMVEGAAAPGRKPEPIEMKLDRPFVFLIVEEASGSVCFTGVVENPLG